jgi:iron complex outermembrane receptor protein
VIRTDIWEDCMMTVHRALASGASLGTIMVAGLLAAMPGTALAQAQTGQQQTSGTDAPGAPTTDQAIAPPVGASPAEDAQKTDDAPPGEAGDIIVTGFRASLANALNQKRESNQIIDSITAEDIADFPDANIAESIQRLPGISIDRDNGEGRTITVRGLGGDFQSVFLNGADALNVAGGNTSDAGANRSRGFDFNTFASELFGGVTITKSTAASNDEGSLGAIIDLTTGRPLSYKKDRLAFSAEAEYRENGGQVNPRLTALFSKRLTDNFGILGSIAYQKQEQQIDRYQRGIGQYDLAYRNSQLNGLTPNQFGFARPAGAGTGILYGSDPASFAKITDTTIIPALPSISRQKFAYDRLGATLTAQWRPTEKSEIVGDFVFSRYNQDVETNSLTTVGLNRNGTNARATILTGTNGLRAVNTANGIADRQAVYGAGCVQSATVDCGQAIYGTTLVPGTRASYNPNNLNTADYYNTPSSVGYVPNANGIGFYDQLIGRPATKIRAANVNAAGQADYLVLDDVDWRTSADAQYSSTQFYQGTLNFKNELSDSFRFDGTVGYSRSEFNAVGLLSEFNAIDQDGYTFDERGNDGMPIFNPGFDVANPNSWSLVKGLSAIRYVVGSVTNQFRVVRGNFTWDWTDELSLRFGGTFKRFNFESAQARRNDDNEVVNPTLAEARIPITQLGQTIGFGKGLDVSQGTPTSFYGPNLAAFRNTFGIDCNCINKWGDFRAQLDGRQVNSVQEKDLSGYVQLDFNAPLFGRPLRGNAGVRIAKTMVDGSGSVGGAANGALGVIVNAHNEYTDVLPATNLNWELTDRFIARFAASATIARPQLQSLTPGTTSFPTGGLNSAGNAPQVTVGNPYLKPFRSTNWDLSFERYFGRSGLIGVAFFIKDLKNFPQQVAGDLPLSAVFDASVLPPVINSIANAGLKTYTQNGGVYAVRQFRDAPGGTIKGLEINLQSNFTFLPAPFDNFGVTANYTHIESKLSYLTGSVTTTRQTGTTAAAVNTFAEGPFLNTSPDAFNATFYYEDSKFSGRFSGAFRKAYVNRFPLAAGTCSIGLTTNNGAVCNSPVLADFGYNEDTFNLDASFAYALTDFAKVTLEGRNLTNTTQDRTIYQANPVTQTYGSTGRIITAGLRVIF